MKITLKENALFYYLNLVFLKICITISPPSDESEILDTKN